MAKCNQLTPLSFTGLNNAFKCQAPSCLDIQSVLQICTSIQCIAIYATNNITDATTQGKSMLGSMSFMTGYVVK